MGIEDEMYQIREFAVMFFLALSCIPLTYLTIYIFKNIKNTYRTIMKNHFRKRYKTVKDITNKKYLYRIKKVAVSNKNNECLKVSLILKLDYSVKTFEINYFKKEPETRIYQTKEKTKIINI